MAHVEQAAETTLICHEGLTDALADEDCPIIGFPHGHVLTLATATVLLHAVGDDRRSILVHVVVP